MGRYAIKDLEKLSGIKAHTLRIWEQRYEVIQPKRTPTKIRYYDDDDLQLILNISFLNRNGYKISRIAQMSKDEMTSIVREISDSRLDYPNQVNALVIAMVNLDELRFEKIIATNSLQFGFEKTMQHIIFPFLRKIGVLWQTGSINPAHEHFISNLIRQKLIVAIDGQVIHRHPDSKTFLLFLPEKEWHELSLLFTYYVVKSRHHNAIYLGQSLPMKDLKSIVGYYNPHYLCTVITSHPSGKDFAGYLNQLKEIKGPEDVLVSGYQAILQKDHVPEQVKLFENISEMIEFIDSLPTPDFLRDSIGKSA